ncbi:MAG: outer membrane beta-barrel protein [Porphyromonas sp.]|nr:outer membrane beta-barrel protein [Porphyromonas sp.]
MKKLFSLFLLALIAVGATQAQEYGFPKEDQHEHSHGNFTFIGGALSFWKNNELKSTSFRLEPEFGYVFNNTWGIGLMLGYNYDKETHAATAEHKEHAHTTNTYSITPFVRYYYMHRGPFNLYMDAGVGFNYADYGKKTKKGFEVGLRPGACIDLTEGLCLCLHMGFVGYRSNYFSSHGDGISSHAHGENAEAFGQNGFGLHFAPEEVSIGLEFEF